MADNLTPEKRSWNMSRIRSRDTQPEIIVRSLIHRMGFRFTLHKHQLPGKPDIFLRQYGCVVLVNGCFWHRHHGCKMAAQPKSRRAFWRKKLNENVKRDKINIEKLSEMGYRVLVLWECEIMAAQNNKKANASLKAKIRRFLRDAKRKL